MQFWETRKWEANYPWVIALAVAALAWILNSVGWGEIGFPKDEGDAQFLLGASLTAGSIFTSFLATALTFFSGMDTPLARRIRETKYQKDVISYFKWAIVASLALCLCALSGPFVGADNNLYFSGWLFFVFFAGGAFWRCVSLLLAMLDVDF